MSLEKNKVDFYQEQLALGLRLGAWIGGPVILAVLIGQWLDRRLSIEPWGFLLCIGLAFPLTMFALVKEAVRAIDKYSDKK